MKAYQLLVEQLGIYLKDLRNLESINPVDHVQQVLSHFHATQEREQKEVKGQIAEQAAIWMTLKPVIRT